MNAKSKSLSIILQTIVDKGNIGNNYILNREGESVDITQAMYKHAGEEVSNLQKVKGKTSDAALTVHILSETMRAESTSMC